MRRPNPSRDGVPGYKRAKARLAYAKLAKSLGEEHVATRAALGRMLFYGGDGYRPSVPQLGSTTVEAVAWYRESGTNPGYWNRTKRKQCDADDILAIYFNDD